jgi:molybdenum cofactor cytidylyltransferase
MRLAAIVLAAGRSRRFPSGNKLLADLEGRAVLAHTLAAVTAAGFDRILLVTGPDHDALVRVAQPFDLQIVRCPDTADGMGHSIAAGVSALTSDIDGVAIVPGDMPLLTPRTLRTLAGAFDTHAGRSIVHPVTHDGSQRNPVFWPRSHIEALRSLDGDRGAKPLIRNAIAVRIADESEWLDVDDPASLGAARTVLRARLKQS